MERRSSGRNENGAAGELVFDNQKIPCSIQNISEGGVLVRLDDEYAAFITSDDVGKEIHFKKKSNPKAEMEYSGRIIRLMYDNGKTFIAIFFLKI